jgi:ribosomal protein S4
MKRGRNKSAKWKNTGRQTKKKGKKLNDTKMGKNKRTQRERESSWGKQRQKQYEFSSILLPAMIEYMVRSLT